jgi:hypothetical protein
MLFDGTFEYVNLRIRQQVKALDPFPDGFLRDCRARELSPFTVEYYRAQNVSGAA